MGKKGKTIVAIGAFLALLVLGRMFFAFKLPPVVIRAEAIPGLEILGVKITNAFITTLMVDLILVLLSILGTRHMKLIPGGFQNFLEWIIEVINNLSHSIAGAKWAPRFFAITTTIFLYVLVSNWFGLIPGLSAFGFCASHEEAAMPPHNAYAANISSDAVSSESAAASSEEQKPPLGCQQGEILIPIFRSPSTDLNNNIALALIAVVMTQVFGISSMGMGYFSKFFNVKGIIKAFGPDEQGRKRNFKGVMSALVLGLIEFFVGVLETISEIAKIISFTFRLFGNIFAGEVMLLVLASLLPLMITLPFLGLEVFVGLIQAFIFYVLTLAFFSIATAGHGEEAH